MKIFYPLILFLSFIIVNNHGFEAHAQQPQKKAAAQKKAHPKKPVKKPETEDVGGADSSKKAIDNTDLRKAAMDSAITADSLAHAKMAVGMGSKKQAAKGKKGKTPAKKQAEKQVEKKDTEPEQKDSVKVTFGRNLVNLRTFKGWIVNERGKWVSSPNRIPFENPEFNNELYKKYELGAENIRQINIEEVKIDSTPYLAFIIESYKGHYRDKMDTDFRVFVGADFFLIKASDYNDLWNDTMKMKHPYQANLRAYYSGLVGYKDIKLRSKYIASEINKDIRNAKYTDTAVKIYLQFGLMPHQTKKEKTMRFNYGLAYARTGTPITPFDYSVFKHRFYEADLELFHKFCRPKSIPVVKKTKPAAEEKKKEEYRDEGPRED